jgi:DDE superfamily endonuclease
VQRQYTGTAGRVENAQVAVYLTYAARRGHALIDRALYLPRSWTEDAERCQQAGVPDSVGFATKPTLATTMITRAVDAGVPAAWVAGDEVYGADPTLRRMVRAHGLGYVLQVAANRRVPTHAGPVRVDELAATVPDSAWQHYSCGPGSKGPANTPGRGLPCCPRTRTTPASTICSSAATTPPASWPTCAATHHTTCRYPPSCKLPGNAGASRKASKPPRASPA